MNNFKPTSILGKSIVSCKGVNQRPGDSPKAFSHARLKKYSHLLIYTKHTCYVSITQQSPHRNTGHSLYIALHTCNPLHLFCHQAAPAVMISCSLVVLIINGAKWTLRIMIQKALQRFTFTFIVLICKGNSSSALNRWPTTEDIG